MIYTDTRVITRTLAALRKGTKLIVHQGGTSSGKTYGNVYALLAYLLYDRRGAYTDGERLLCSMVAEDMPQVKRGVLRDFRDIISKTGLDKIIKYNKTDNFATLPSGTIIEFLAIDDEDKAKAGKRDLLFVNEANNLDYMIYWHLKIRTRECVVMDYNPSGDFWFHENELPKLLKDDYLFTRTTYLDNPALSAEMKKEIESIDDDYLSLVYKEGKTGKLKGVIFNVVFVDAFPDDCKKISYGLDFGYTNDPTTIVKGGVKENNLYLEGLCYETNLTNDDIAEKLKELELQKKDEIWADSAEPKSIEEIKRLGFNIKATKKGTDSIDFGIQLLKKYKIHIVKNDVNFRKEAQNYKWKEFKGKMLNVPIDKFNHYWDASRYYAIMTLSSKRFSKVHTTKINLNAYL
jgi:phage terminase large subunit